MAFKRRSVKRSLAILRCEARQEVRRESLCCLCQDSGQEGDGVGQVLRGHADMPVCVRLSVKERAQEYALAGTLP
jgi:hypothetical protein